MREGVSSLSEGCCQTREEGGRGRGGGREGAGEGAIESVLCFAYSPVYLRVRLISALPPPPLPSPPLPPLPVCGGGGGGETEAHSCGEGGRDAFGQRPAEDVRPPHCCSGGPAQDHPQDAGGGGGGQHGVWTVFARRVL